MLTRRSTLLAVAIAAAAGCTGATAPTTGSLEITQAEYRPRPQGSTTDSVVLRIRSTWHAGQFALVVAGRQWPSAQLEVAADGSAVLTVVLVRAGVPPLTFPDTITASAINFTPTSRVTR